MVFEGVIRVLGGVLRCYLGERRWVEVLFGWVAVDGNVTWVTGGEWGVDGEFFGWVGVGGMWFV